MRHILLLPLALAACTATAPAPAPVPPPTPEARLEAECALLAHAAGMMSAAGMPPHDGLREGCPGETALDTRPLPRQTAALREANSTPLPAGLIPGSRGEEVFRRMITRGVPVSLAAHLITEPVFAAAAR